MDIFAKVVGDALIHSLNKASDVHIALQLSDNKLQMISITRPIPLCESFDSLYMPSRSRYKQPAHMGEPKAGNSIQSVPS